MHVGGGEFYQLYRLANGQMNLLTDGKSRNEFGSWDQEGRLVGYSSTRRNGTDSDLYVVDPRDPDTNRLVAQVKGGGWGISDFAPGGATAAVIEYISITKSNPYLLDVASGKLTPIGNHKKDIAYGSLKYAPDGTLWATSDEGSDVQRLGRLNPANGQFTPVSPKGRWDVDNFEISKDGRTIAFVTNEAGVDRLSLLDVASGSIRPVSNLPAGSIGNLDFAPWGPLGFALTSAKSPSDAYSLDPATLQVTRWTESETGGLDPNRNVEPELIEVKSFDGEAVSGFLYRPDPAKFPGKRPLIVNIHGGPESQTKPGFLGRNNYLINELGIAIFFPNVRGSSGYGKRFVSLDNGPFKREDSVKDIGAFPGSPRGRSGHRRRPHVGHRRKLRRLHVLRLGDHVRGPLQGRALQRRHLQLRDLPREYAELSPRPAPRRIWRRARSEAARQAARDFAASPDFGDQGAALHRPGRKRSARTQVGSRPDRKGRAGSRHRSLVSRRPE